VQRDNGTRVVGPAVLALAVVMALSGCDRFVDADTRVQRAEEHFAKGDFRPAMSELKAALQKDPNHVAARIDLARLSWWLGDVDSAEKEIQRAVEAGADPAQVREIQYDILVDRRKGAELTQLMDGDAALKSERRNVLEARLALAEQNFDAARAAIDKAVAAAPDDPDVIVESARVDAATGKGDSALHAPERVADSPAAHARAMFMRGIVQMSLGTAREARDTLKAAQSEARTLRAPEQLAIAVAYTEVELALNDASAAEQGLKQIEAWAPGSTVSHYMRARVAILKRDYETAVAECQRVLRIEPQHVQAQLLLASAHVSAGALEQAQDTLTRLLASKPDAVAARKLLAQVYLGRNQPDEARKVLGASTTSDTDMDWLMGTALMQSGSSADAFEYLERSAQARPTDIARRVELASAYIGARKPERAIELLEGVPAESPLASRAKVLTVLATAAGKPAAQAKKEVQELAARNPKDAGLLSAAGGVLAGSGDLEGGRKLLNQAVALEPNRVDARLALARIDGAERKFDDAQGELLEVVKIDPANQPARIALAELAWMRGDRKGAQTWLEDAIKADPAAVDARLRLAQIAFVEGDGARAHGLLDQVLAVAKDRNSVLSATGRILARAGFSDEALARFNEALAAGDRSAHLDSAKLYLDMNQREKARQSAEAALAANPTSREAQQLLIMMDAREGQVDRAFDRAKRLLTDATPANEAQLRGDLQAMAKQFDAASTSYENAQRLQPSGQTAIKLFQVRRAAGASGAERSLTQWLDRSPGDAAVRRTLALYYESVGQADRAMAEYERLVGGNAADPMALNNLAWMLHQKGDARAVDLAKRAHEAAPHYPEIADTYGWILVRMGKVPDGLAVLQSALANAPTNPDILYHAAFALQKSGDVARATKLVNEALESKRDFGSRADAVQLARELSERKTA
jgi:cellulose synthase operon protein C